MKEGKESFWYIKIGSIIYKIYSSKSIQHEIILLRLLEERASKF